MIMFAMFVGVLVTLFIGVTTAGSMAFISIATYIGMGDATLNNMIRLPSSMYDQVKGITLMAIPFFLLMGNFMNRGGVSKDLFAFARACLGHRWGGLANAAIASCMIMSAMSGSAAAVAAGVGMIAIAEMRNTGYHQPFSCAAIAAGGGLGPIIPPSITLILFASLVPGTSVNALFLGGAIPGILTGLFFIIYASYESRHSNFGKVPAVPMKERVRLGIKAIWALLIPVIVLGGIFIGLFTATEAAAVAAFYSMLLGMFKYRQLKLADLPGIFWATAKSTGQIMFVIATAAFFQHVLLKTRARTATNTRVRAASCARRACSSAATSSSSVSGSRTIPSACARSSTRTPATSFSATAAAAPPAPWAMWWTNGSPWPWTAAISRWGPWWPLASTCRMKNTAACPCAA